MEIRKWFDQELVLPADMNGTSSDMYQRSFDYNNFPPVILYGLQLVGVVGNTVAFTVGAARTQEITVASYPYLPTAPYGTGYPGIIEIAAGHNSVTLDTSITPCFIVATYSISPTSANQTLYTTSGNLAQVASVDPTKEVILAKATYAMGVWTVDQTPVTNRDNDMAALSAVQYDLTQNKLQIGSPQGLTSVQTTLIGNVLVTFSLNVSEGIYDGNNYLLNTSKVDVATTLTPINALVSGSSTVEFTGSDVTTVNGIIAGIAQGGAQQLLIFNGSSANITFVNNSGSAAAPDKIQSISGDIILGPGFCLQFFYNNTTQKWIPVKSS